MLNKKSTKLENVPIVFKILGEGFPCDICGAIFSERYKLQRHIETHMNKVAETCIFCGKFFNSSKIYAKHLEVHERKGLSYFFCM